ncbi:hypothetical protein [Leifsonia sp. SIMBA_070]|uniref:hypothetical protein n=1 Tax=Leifsonia sp. SIMBA_070 TaxID=3085810 RepID=UPI00397DF6F5
MTAATPGAGGAGASYGSGTSMTPLLGQTIGEKFDEITERFPDRLRWLTVPAGAGGHWFAHQAILGLPRKEDRVEGAQKRMANIDRTTLTSCTPSTKPHGS